MIVFFFKQKTAYEMRISDWSSDVGSSDLFDPAVDDRFAIFLVRGAGIVGDLAVGDIVAPRLDDARRAIVAEHFGCLLRQRAIGFLIAFGDGHDLTVDIADRKITRLNSRH